jgi:hypothetical protein
MSQRPPLDRQAQGPQSEIIFSLVDGYVWATWPGTDASVRLGTYESVTAMMCDFLAQSALAEQLSKRDGIGPF